MSTLGAGKKTISFSINLDKEEDIEKAINLKKDCMQFANEKIREKQDEMAEKNWKINDAAKGGRAMFKYIGGDFTLPTTTMIDPRTKEPTSNNKRIFEIFLGTWKGIFNRHKENPPSWEIYDAHYGQHIPINESVETG